MRSELELTRANLKDYLAQRDQYHSDLAVAEMRLDRLQSRTVRAIHARAKSPSNEPSVNEESVDVKEEGDGVKVKEERMSSSPAVSGQFIGGRIFDLTFLFLSNSRPAIICSRSYDRLIE